MQVVDGLEALGRDPFAGTTPSVVCVGVFDGVHLGHQRLLHELLEWSSELQGSPTVVTFTTHPDAVLRGEAPPLLVSLPHRLRLLRRAGVQRALLLPFAPDLRELPAEVFAARVLRQGLHARGILLGFDSAFGKDRTGTPQVLEALGFAVRIAGKFLVDGTPVSSTAIRKAIRAGDLELARRYLGRWPSAYGEVQAGDRRGQTLGFPTANLVPQATILPPPGVYAVEVIHEGETRPGVANLGQRPTFAAGGAPLGLEVHLLDFHGDLYGKTLEVGFVRALRSERKFASAAELAAQIARDVATARKVLGC